MLQSLNVLSLSQRISAKLAHWQGIRQSTKLNEVILAIFLLSSLKVTEISNAESFIVMKYSIVFLLCILLLFLSSSLVFLSRSSLYT